MSRVDIASRGDGHYALTGELTFATVPNLWRRESGVFGKDATVRLDLAGILRIDSAGIALLIELTRTVRKYGGTLSLENAPPQLMAIAAVSGLDEVLPFARNAER